MGATATVYVVGDLLAVDCDICHQGLLGEPTVAIGSDWIAIAVSDHQTECQGKP